VSHNLIIFWLTRSRAIRVIFQVQKLADFLQNGEMRNAKLKPCAEFLAIRGPEFENSVYSRT